MDSYKSTNNNGLVSPRVINTAEVSNDQIPALLDKLLGTTSPVVVYNTDSKQYSYWDGDSLVPMRASERFSVGYTIGPLFDINTIAPTVLPFDFVFEINPLLSLSGNEITIGTDGGGIYEISYDIYAESATASVKNVELSLGTDFGGGYGYNSLLGSYLHINGNNNRSGAHKSSVFFNLPSGTKLRMESVRIGSAGALNIIPGRNTLNLRRIEKA